jgi:hypothetical protein
VCEHLTLGVVTGGIGKRVRHVLVLGYFFVWGASVPASGIRFLHRVTGGWVYMWLECLYFYAEVSVSVSGVFIGVIGGWGQ